MQTPPQTPAGQQLFDVLKGLDGVHDSELADVDGRQSSIQLKQKLALQERREHVLADRLQARVAVGKYFIDDALHAHGVCALASMLFCGSQVRQMCQQPSVLNESRAMICLLRLPSMDCLTHLASISQVVRTPRSRTQLHAQPHRLKVAMRKKEGNQSLPSHQCL